MKKNCIYLLLGLFISFQLVGCAEENDEDDLYTIGKEYDGAYGGVLKLTYSDGTSAEFPQKVYLAKSQLDAMVNLSMKYLKIDGKPVLTLQVNDVNADADMKGGTLSLSTNQQIPSNANTPTYHIDLKGTVQEGIMNFNATLDFDAPAELGVIKAEFNGKLANSSEGTEATLLEVGFVEENIFIIEGSRIYGDVHEVYLATVKGVTSSDLNNLTPILRVSNGATVSPALGEPQNFNEPVSYTITSEDEVVQHTYVFKIFDRPEVESFDNWVVADPSLRPEGQYLIPQELNKIYSWTSLDQTYANLMHNPTTSDYEKEPLKPVDQFCVQPVADAVSGRAAKIMTQKARAQELYKVPSILSGMLYTGVYGYKEAELTPQALFGVPFHYKPQSLKFSYKYTKGSIYYETLLPNSPYQVEEVNRDNQFIVRAVLYKVNNRFNLASRLTYEELFTSTNIVATAELVSSVDKSSYTTVDIPFTYSADYSYQSEYQLALMISSSTENQIYSGAPGSTLLLDNLEIVVE